MNAIFQWRCRTSLEGPDAVNHCSVNWPKNHSHWPSLIMFAFYIIIYGDNPFPPKLIGFTVFLCGCYAFHQCCYALCNLFVVICTA